MIKVSSALFSLSLLILCAPGCTAPPEAVSSQRSRAPAWVMKAPVDSIAVYAVGFAEVRGDVVLAREKAEDVARQEIARIIDVKVDRAMERFVLEHRDLLIPGASRVLEFASSVSRSASQASLGGCRIAEDWQDRDNGMIYALAVISWKEVVDQVNDHVASMQHSIFLEQKHDEAMRSMDTALEYWEVSR